MKHPKTIHDMLVEVLEILKKLEKEKNERCMSPALEEST